MIRGLAQPARTSRSPGLETNGDGSVELYFGPAPPEGKQSNWVSTDAGGVFEVAMRFYGPTPALYDKSWKLPDIEALK